MAASATPQPPAAFETLGIPVEIPQVEKTLRRLFLGDDDSGGAGLARASVVNLALYSEDPGSVAEQAALLGEITNEAACRSLLLAVDPSAAEAAARAWVQVHCRIDRDGRKTVCSEQISFLLSRPGAAMLRNLVFAHLDSDLPLVFWWRGEFSELFEEGLYSRIDRLIFDSGAWSLPRNSMLRLGEASGGGSAGREGFAMHDLAYSRINPVRLAVANAFERPALAAQLGALREVRLRHAPGYRMSCLYLAAWLASRLGATLDARRSSPDELRYRSPREEGPSRFQILVEPWPEGRVGFLEADLALDEVRVEISSCQTRDFIRTLIHRPGVATEEDWLPGRAAGDAALVTGILNRAGRNRAYRRLLPGMLELLALG
jgi:glucose-6-phosphate dehydrogenase assembly protein OpcA